MPWCCTRVCVLQETPTPLPQTQYRKDKTSNKYKIYMSGGVGRSFCRLLPLKRIQFALCSLSPGIEPVRRRTALSATCHGGGGGLPRQFRDGKFRCQKFRGVCQKRRGKFVDHPMNVAVRETPTPRGRRGTEFSGLWPVKPPLSLSRTEIISRMHVNILYLQNNITHPIPNPQAATQKAQTRISCNTIAIWSSYFEKNADIDNCLEGGLGLGLTSSSS